MIAPWALLAALASPQAPAPRRKLRPVIEFSGRSTGALDHSTVVRRGSVAVIGSVTASRWQTMVRPSSSSRICHQAVLAAKKATLPPRRAKFSTLSRISIDQYSSWPFTTNRR